MGRLTARLLRALVLAATGVALVPAQAALALMVWTLDVSPDSAVAGQSTTFTLVATNLDLLTELGCLEVDLPASFSISSVSEPSASNDDEWAAFVSGTTVVAHSLSGGGRLELTDSVTFQVTATPSSAGATTWTNHAHRQQDCSGTDQTGFPVTVTVAPAPATPAPTPTPTLVPTPRPTATPRPSIPLPNVSLPPLFGTPVPSPSAPRPSTSPSPTDDAQPTSGRPSPSAAAPSTVGGGTAETPQPAGTIEGPGQPTGPRIARDGSGGVTIGTGGLGLFDGAAVWSVPAAVISVPGVLVLLWVALQTVGALAWIPAVRRLRGEERRQPVVVRR